MIALIQMWIFLLLAVALLAVEVWALINALRFRADAYVAAGKRTKVFWGVLTGGSGLLGFLSLPYPVGRGGSMLVTVAGVGIAGLLLGDVLPALRRGLGRARRAPWW